MSALPPKSKIESALKEAVGSIFASGDDVTVNKARAAAEADLGIDPGSLKSDDEWKERSKAIIHAAHEEVESAPPKPAITKAKPGPKVTPKRATTTADQPRKRRKTVESDKELDDFHSDAARSDNEDAVTSAPKPVPKRKATKAAPVEAEESSELSEAGEDITSPDDEDANKTVAAEANGGAESESEMSDVIDEPAPKKKRASKASQKDAKKSSNATKARSSKAAKSADISPDAAEIKRLQGWLVKCGIRKIWGVYLKPYETDKAKIKHLKGMLEEAGMTGRYSNEKASSIKDANELAAEVAAVKEGNKQWGQDKDARSTSESEVDEPAPPARRSVTSRFVDFGDEDEDDD